MDVAECRIKSKPKPIFVSAKDDILTGRIAEEDIIESRCPYCKKLASLVHDPRRILHYKAEHPRDCPAVNDGRKHKSRRILVDKEVDAVEDIINYRDNAPCGPVTPPYGGDHENEPEHDHFPDDNLDDIDQVIHESIRRIHSVSGLYNLIRELGRDADLGNGKTGRDLLLDAYALLDVRWNRDINGIRIAIATRVNPKTLSHQIMIPPGYVLFKDRFSENERDTIYYLVKLNHEEQNNVFRNRTMGTREDPAVRDPHKDILLMARWARVPNDYYLVFSGNINTRCYHFFNYRE